MSTITTQFLETLPIQELLLLKAKVDIILREKRIRNVFSHQKDIKNPLTQTYFIMLELELSKTFPSCSKINDILDTIEFVLKLDID